MSTDLNFFDGTLDANLPDSSAIAPYCTSKPEYKLGDLASLPNEILQAILPHLDLRTLTAFMCVNRKALQLVVGLPQYRVIKEHASKALREALAIGVGASITCNDFFDLLCKAECEDCGDFGGYLYLLTFKRVCSICFIQKRKYLPLRAYHAKEELGLSPREIDNLPRMTSLIGNYTPKRTPVKMCITLFDFTSAQVAQEGYLAPSLLAPPGTSSVTPPSQSIRARPENSKLTYALRFMAVVRAPWYNETLREAEMGVRCDGCQVSSGPGNTMNMNYKRMFSTATFKEHLAIFRNVKDGKHQ